MIGRPEWFERRKYGGWGLTPKTWQGWAYVGIFLAPIIVFHSMPFWSDMTRMIVTGVWILALLFDAVDIMAHMKKDEREYMLEAISERNAAWAMIAVMVAAILYESITAALKGEVYFNWWILATLFAGVIAKGISNYVLERK